MSSDTVAKLSDIWEQAEIESKSTGENIFTVYNRLLKEAYKKGAL